MTEKFRQMLIGPCACVWWVEFTCLSQRLRGVKDAFS